MTKPETKKKGRCTKKTTKVKQVRESNRNNKRSLKKNDEINDNERFTKPKPERIQVRLTKTGKEEIKEGRKRNEKRQLPTMSAHISPAHRGIRNNFRFTGREAARLYRLGTWISPRSTKCGPHVLVLFRSISRFNPSNRRGRFGYSREMRWRPFDAKYRPRHCLTLQNHDIEVCVVNLSFCLV